MVLDFVPLYLNCILIKIIAHLLIHFELKLHSLKMDSTVNIAFLVFYKLEHIF